ncbi:MAG: response regulator [Thermodesulfobacteriota bacterium]
MVKALLILDPEEHNRWVLKTLLESEGYKVFCASTIDEALKIFLEYKFHGLISEYWIGPTSSLEVIKKFKELSPEGYVMILANDDVQENEYQEIIKAGVDDFFLKPFPTRRILLHLQKGLRQHKDQNQNQLEFIVQENPMGAI